MSRPVAWSYSALAMFENCPRQYFEVKIKKSVKQENYAASEGAQKHKEIELYLTQDQKPKSPEILSAMPVIDHFRYMPGKVYPEYAMALDQRYQPCEYKDWNNAWLRAVSDVVVVDGDKAVLADWKFGKPRDGDDQVKLTAAVTFLHFPRVQQVDAIYVYLANRMTSPTYSYQRTDLPDIWQGFMARYSVLLKTVQAGQASDWIPKPSGLCGYCSVLTCEFNRKR